MPRAKLIYGSPDDIETAYYDALSRSDITALMALWADDEEIVCIHPGGPRLIGHAAIREAWEDIFSRGSVHIRPRQLHSSHNMMTAAHSLIEEIHHAATMQTDVHVIATNVFIKTAKGWRIVMHHASIASGQAPQESMAGALLH
ncbi:nuclear transport factor 2 family protein [Herbaspirillum sp. RTI4]|uniref:YybH family protein n=1 Tax=Herbaspirillum sp. RTI4 TaxID=3048640 RepID=UPI002AB4E103|nr:nuclear transport factor 2 family protein [Herbaspirillum sp. RTI4]MDY7576802.1 nuclear transport factor 2 family protein [Herbaspirillum sp. RTI4]MEA9981398.1 DUF3225 domain-containing protein [Herbaspirillum sp. RTI4]